MCVKFSEKVTDMKSVSETMADAVRLTRDGRLADATKRLADLLGNAAPPATSRSANAPAAGGPTLELAPPAAGTASWTLPGKAPAGALPAPPLASVIPGLAKLKIPPVLKGLAERIDRVGADLGLVAGKRAPLAVPGGARFIEASYANAAGQRRYKLYIPSGYRGEPVPLVVMLHGCTQSPDDFAAGTRMNEVAEDEVCLVAYPAQSSSANAQGCWNWFQAKDQLRDSGEPSLIAGIVRQIAADYAVDPARIYIAGLSAGGAAAANMAGLYPDLFAAVGIHSGLACGAAADLPSALTAMKQGSSGRSGKGPGVPVIVFHGDRDQVVNPVNADHVMRGSGAPAAASDLGSTAGVSAGGRRYSVAQHRDPKGQVFAENWTIHGGGHAWSGGDAAGSYTDPSGPNASREMMRFFLGQRLPRP